MSDEISSLKQSTAKLSEDITQIFNKKGKEVNLIQEHMVSSLDDLNKSIAGLEKNIALGIPLTEAGDNLDRLTTLTKEIKSIESKLNVYSTKAKELSESYAELDKIVAGKISETQFDTLVEKVKYLEKIYSSSSISKTNDSIKSLIGIINNLETRIKFLEDKIKNEVDNEIVLEKMIKQNIYEESRKDMPKEQKKQGFFSKIKSFFGLS